MAQSTNQSSGEPGHEHASASAFAQRIAETLGADITVGKTINVHGHSIIPLVRTKVSIRESHSKPTGEKKSKKLANILNSVIGDRTIVQWQSEPVALIITAEGTEPLLVKLETS